MLEPNETYRIGRFYMNGTRLARDQESERIYDLTKNHLTLISSHGPGAVFVDPKDGRYWELREYLGALQGGGPKLLHCVPEKFVKSAYNGSWHLQSASDFRERYTQMVAPSDTDILFVGICFESMMGSGIAVRQKIDWLVESVFKKISTRGQDELLWDDGTESFWEHAKLEFPDKNLGGTLRNIASGSSILHPIDEHSAKQKFGANAVNRGH